MKENLSSRDSSQAPSGLVCRRCGCRHFYTVYTRPKAGWIVRRKQCRHCGQRVLTKEQIVG